MGTPAQNAAIWAQRAGFSGYQLIDIVAIGGAESGWRTNAHALTSREDSRGVWQINVWAHPWGTSINLYDGQTNAEAAMRVYREAGYSFGPWSTYNDKAYLNYWQEAQFATSGLTGIVGGVVNPGPVAEVGGSVDHSSYVASLAVRTTLAKQRVRGYALLMDQDTPY
jgi:Lysozyme like domain